MRLLHRILSSAALASTALAGNLVINPGFESGNLSGWTSRIFVVVPALGGAGPHSGGFHASSACAGASCSTDLSTALIQQLATTSEFYTLSFWYDLGDTANGDPGHDVAELRVLWGSATVMEVTAAEKPDAGYVFFSVSGLKGDPAGTQLKFFGRNDAHLIALDDVCVAPAGDSACGGNAGPPEPAWAWVLGGAIIAAGGIAMWKRFELFNLFERNRT